MFMLYVAIPKRAQLRLNSRCLMQFFFFFSLKENNKIMFSFFFYPLKCDQKRKSEHLEIWHRRIHSWLGCQSLSCRKPASCKHGWRTSEVLSSNPRCSRLKYESNIILLNRAISWAINSHFLSFWNPTAALSRTPGTRIETVSISAVLSTFNIYIDPGFYPNGGFAYMQNTHVYLRLSYQPFFRLDVFSPVVGTSLYLHDTDMGPSDL